MIASRTIWLCVSLLLGTGLARAADVRIGVLGLFHPHEIVVRPVSGKVLECSSGDRRWTVQSPFKVQVASDELLAGDQHFKSPIECDDGQNGATEFVVAVPQKISRHYGGALEISAQTRELVIVIGMDLETAVASVVAAESLPGAPMQALEAQAVAARSFLAAGKGRHRGFDFCDTTHCQFLREPPVADSSAARATEATRGLVLASKDEVFAALYSSSCGGTTHTLEQLGIPIRNYPYFSVRCDYCHRHPEKWVAEISAEEAASLKGTEKSRLRLARKLGWRVLPSNSFSVHEEGDKVIIDGVGTGHGIGLCQRGAADMARRGATFRQILEHYYPNTSLKQL